ncbi:AAA family ATPase [Janibacter cremeus]|uniref:DNA-binding NarL/FixJ family response regulator n=1 Tax=Janibacter cremeus TaxID=1285192 RepID=A0A852VTV8_9MICO|nr:DNA-binding NarL/FixJ family response regulator [Janibacter cremeus]
MALVGRSTEQEALSRLLASARLGRGGALVVTGEPGVGKTALLADALAPRDGPTDTHLLRVTATEIEQDLPFATLHALLHPALDVLDELPEPQAHALAMALRLRAGVGSDRFAIGAATLGLLTTFAEGAPVIVVLDDLHWADVPSIEALAFAARRLSNDPIAMLLAGRSGELPTAVSDLDMLEVPGLTAAGSARLMAKEHPALGHATVRELHRTTGGNPLALLELSTDPTSLTASPVSEVAPGVLATLPDRLRSAYTRRLDSLAPDTRVSALVAVVAGGDPRLVRAVCQRLGVDDEAELQSAQEGGLLRVGSHITFRHPILRSVVYDSASARLRRTVHLAVADELTTESDRDRQIWHRAAGATRLDEALARQLDELGRRASERAAFTVASTAHERAARWSPTPQGCRFRLVTAADAAWDGGQRERALALLDEAEPAGGTVTSSGSRLRARIATQSGSLREGLVLLERAAGIADPDDRVRLLAEACHACMYLTDMTSLHRVEAQLTTSLTRATGPDTRAIGLAAAGAAQVLLGQGGAPLIRAALPRLGLQIGPLADPSALTWPMLARLFLRETDQGGQLRRLVDDARTRIGIGALPSLLFHVARDEATTRAWDRAEANYDEAIRLARETGLSTELAISLAGRACLESRRGGVAACRTYAQEALELCRARSLHFGEIWCELALGDLDLSQGSAPEAALRYLALNQLLQEHGVRDPDLHPGPDLVDALLRLGRRDEAAEVAHGFIDLARALGRPWTLARAERALALMAPDQDVDAHVSAALTHHDRTRDVYETARTHLAHGIRLRRAGRRVDAREALRRGLAIFDELGAAIWGDATRSELEATGERVPAREATGPRALTPQELQVCVLLTEGRTTREAAAALFLSPKTVEYHLRKVYLKLDIHSRGELATIIHSMN